MPHERLKDDVLLMIEHLDEINAYFEAIKKPEDFFSSTQGKAFYDAILMHLQVTGEILKRNYTVHEHVFKEHKDVPWNEIIRLRDIISHHYDKLQHEIVFDICSHYIKPLRTALLSVVQSL